MNTQTTSILRKYSQNRYKAAAALLAAFASAGVSHAQTTWVGNTSTDLNAVANWSGVVPSATVYSTFTTVGSSGASLSLTADLQFGGGTAGSGAGSNAMLFNGDAFTIAGNSGTRQLTIGGQGLAINTTNTITIDVPRIRRNASNTFEFIGSSGNLVINGDYSTNITTASDTITNIDFSTAGGSNNSNNTLTFNGAFVNVFTGAAGAGLGNVSLKNATSGTGNKVVFNNTSNIGITGTVSSVAGTEIHLGNGGTNGTLAGASINVSSGRFVINQSDSVSQGVEFANTAIIGGGSLEQAGAGTTTLSAANTFSGGVIVSAGTLTISASERINNVNKLTLSGGSFSASTFTETLGVLDLNGTGGTLNVGDGGKLVFADSSAELWAGSLSITGSFVSGSSVRFGLLNTGLTGTQLSSIVIPGFDNISLNSSGFITATSAVPEPSAFAAFAGLGAVAFAGLRRRRCV